MESFFEVIDYHNLSKTRLREEVGKMSLSQIGDIAESLSETVKASTSHQMKREDMFDLYLGGSLNGSSDFGCRNLSCRLDTLKKAGAFSVLYSNKAYIPDYFNSYHHLVGKLDESQMKQRFFDNLIVINELRGAFEKGKLELFHLDLCPTCASVSLAGFDNIFTKEYIEELTDFYLDNLEAEVRFYRGGKLLKIEDKSQSLLDHEGIFRNDKILQNVPDGKVGREVLKEIGLVKKLIMKELSVLKFHYANSSYLGTPLLTDRNAHDKFLSQVNIQNEYSKYNSVMQQLHLETPIVENVSIDSIIRLKEAEEDAFENYKITLKKSIQSFVKEKDSITSEMIQEFYNDNIASELINLNRKMRNSKSLATKKTLGGALITGVALGVGLTTQFVSPTVLQTLGLFTFLGTTGTSAIDMFQTPNDIKNSNYYLLWKLQNSK